MSSPNKKQKTSASERSTTSYDFKFLQGVKAVIIEQSLGKTRATILAKQLVKNSGERHSKLQADTTHVLIDKKITFLRLKKILKEDSLNSNIVYADWLSDCLTAAKCLDVGPYLLLKGDELVCSEEQAKVQASGPGDVSTSTKQEEKSDFEQESKPSTSADKTVKKRKIKLAVDSDESDYVDSGDEGTERHNADIAEICPEVSPEKLGGKWICTQASDAQDTNHNKHVTDKLEILANAYKNTSDKWRAMTNNKAILSIKSYHKPLESYEEVKGLPFVGERLAQKIWEILQTGHLRRLDHMDPNLEIIELFTNIWGAGPKTAQTWVSQGLKTLDDVRNHGNPTRQQLIGLEFYDDFLDRMTRDEVQEIEKEVEKAAHNISPFLECVTCGSYRRGQKTCGDVDILISHPDGRSHKGVMDTLLKNLKENGFLTHDLTLAVDGDQKKYLGVCKLPGEGRKHRRIDIIVVPYSEWSCALVYFTGSAYLNRSMRLLAQRKNMSLNHHSLNSGVVRKGTEKISEGTPVPVFSEKDIFQYLGLDYLEPHQRDW